MKKNNVPTETLLSLRKQGLSYAKIGAEVGMSKDGVRKRIDNYNRHGGDPKLGRPKYNPPPLKTSGPLATCKTYQMPPEEIERRYGKPGSMAEPSGTAITYGWPDGGEKNERHYLKRGEANG